MGLGSFGLWSITYGCMLPNLGCSRTSESLVNPSSVLEFPSYHRTHYLIRHQFYIFNSNATNYSQTCHLKIHLNLSPSKGCHEKTLSQTKGCDLNISKWMLIVQTQYVDVLTGTDWRLANRLELGTIDWRHTPLTRPDFIIAFKGEVDTII